MATSSPEITTENIQERIAGSFPADMGVEPLELTDERCRGGSSSTTGISIRGGSSTVACGCALADSVAAWQTFRHLPPGYDFTTIEMKLNVLAGGRPGDELIATAEHLHAGRTTHVVEVRVHRGDRLVANLLVTQLVLAPPSVPRAPRV